VVAPGVIEKSLPVPESVTVCVPAVASLALSVIVSVALRDPAAEGVKDTLIVQFFPAATAPVVLQVEFDSTAKSLAAEPEIARPLIVSEALPLLVRVIVDAEEAVPTFSAGNETEPGASDTSGAVPVPVRLTVCVLFAVALLLSVIVKVAPRVLIPEGVKVTLMVQLAPAATDVPQVLLSAKSLPLVPLTAMPLMESAAEPVLLNVIV